MSCNIEVVAMHQGSITVEMPQRLLQKPTQRQILIGRAVACQPGKVACNSGANQSVKVLIWLFSK
jgi:hypothetical protein